MPDTPVEVCLSFDRPGSDVFWQEALVGGNMPTTDVPAVLKTALSTVGHDEMD